MATECYASFVGGYVEGDKCQCWHDLKHPNHGAELVKKIKANVNFGNDRTTYGDASLSYLDETSRCDICQKHQVMFHCFKLSIDDLKSVMRKSHDPTEIVARVILRTADIAYMLEYDHTNQISKRIHHISQEWFAHLDIDESSGITFSELHAKKASEIPYECPAVIANIISETYVLEIIGLSKDESL